MVLTLTEISKGTANVTEYDGGIEKFFKFYSMNTGGCARKKGRVLLLRRIDYFESNWLSF